MIHDYLDLDYRGDVAVVWIDEQDAKVNRLNRRALQAFDAVVDELEQSDRARAVVFISRKPSTFIAGADLTMIRELETPAEVRTLIREGHRLMARVQTLDLPTVAAIHGAAMGGGLEVALACDYRIATDADATKLALPEVKLGLLPGSGGTQRLPRLVGLQQSLDMMLTGKNIYPRKAKRIGLVDDLIYEAGLLDAALQAARGLADGTLRPDRDLDLTDKLLGSTSLSRKVVYQQAESNVKQETKGNYPAPFKILECVKTGMEQGFEAGLQKEEELFAELVFTPESKALVGLFFAKQEADKNPWADDVRDVHLVGVLGAGLMGGGIAEVSAEGDMDVIVKDIDLEHAASAKKVVWDDLKKKVKKRIISSFERDQLVERVSPVGSYDRFDDVDLVIEAVPENLDIKHQVLRDVEAVAREDCIFASNTSSIPITDIAEASDRPETVLGMHYFSPVPKMPLLEVIRTEQTADWALATAYDVGQRQGKTVIVVNDGPGFYTTRILAVYMNEALLLLEEGADIEQVDRAMVQWGFPMGPYTLFDLVGVDVGAKITEVMKGYLKDRVDRDMNISESATKLVDAGYTGQKDRIGFYQHAKENGEVKKQELNESIYTFFGGPDRKTMDAEDIQRRLGLLMVNEAVYCLEEGILESPRDGDLGAVFGLGFPPFRGGPFRYIDQETAPAIAARLSRLELRHGDRYRPSALLQQHAQDGTAFYAG
jgi:3-hydroxyacyl-CoA dehydrogenase/enoyl-CoA hydratase/3-hydroxybutyryl-CoA epimerase